jgi:lysyl-tRNA synthetase class 2
LAAGGAGRPHGRYSGMPSSAAIRSYWYNPRSHELSVVFHTMHTCTYKEVPREMFVAMKAAFSKGEFFNRHIRNKFVFSPNTNDQASIRSASPTA